MTRVLAPGMSWSSPNARIKIRLGSDSVAFTDDMMLIRVKDIASTKITFGNNFVLLILINSFF
jgi:hypothetical protein